MDGEGRKDRGGDHNQGGRCRGERRQRRPPTSGTSSPENRGESPRPLQLDTETGQPWGDPLNSSSAGEWKPRHQLIRRHAGRRTAGAGGVTSTRSGGDPAHLLPRREGKTTVRVTASGRDRTGRRGQTKGPVENTHTHWEQKN